MNEILENCTNFEWDKGNSLKNWLKHNVTISESEQVFFNKPLVISKSKQNAKEEKRWYLLGKTDANTKLFIVFTVRGNSIRVISSRDMSKKERDVYEEKNKKSSKI